MKAINDRLAVERDLAFNVVMRSSFACVNKKSKVIVETHLHMAKCDLLAT